MNHCANAAYSRRTVIMVVSCPDVFNQHVYAQVCVVVAFMRSKYDNPASMLDELWRSFFVSDRRPHHERPFGEPEPQGHEFRAIYSLLFAFAGRAFRPIHMLVVWVREVATILLAPEGSTQVLLLLNSYANALRRDDYAFWWSPRCESKWPDHFLSLHFRARIRFGHRICRSIRQIANRIR